jgi:hypothetical protein
MEDIIGFDEQVSGIFDRLRKITMPKLPNLQARPSIQNAAIVLTPEERKLILTMRANKRGNFFKQIKQAAKPVVTRYKKRNFFGF